MSSKTNLNLFILGNFVSLLGSSMQRTALPLFILDLTGKGSAMSLLTLSHMIPMLLTTPLAGVIGDRTNRKKIMVLMDLLRGLVVIPLAVLGLRGQLNLPIIFTIMALSAVLDSLFSAATGAMLPELVSEDKLREANSFNSIFTSIAELLGPLFGAITYSFLGIGAIFVFNALAYLISGFLEMFIKYDFKPAAEKSSLKEFYESAKAGLEFINNNSQLKTLVGFALLFNFLIAPLFSVVLPYTAKEVLQLSSVFYGLMGTFITAGFIIGASLVGTVLAKKPSGSLFKGGIFAVTTLIFLFTILITPLFLPLFANDKMSGPLILLGILIVLGISLSITNIPLNTDLQKLTPNHIRSRVFSTTSLLSQIAIPIGVAINGFALDYINPYIISGFVSMCFLATAIFFARSFDTASFLEQTEVEKAK